jgi:hypothetical protein
MTAAREPTKLGKQRKDIAGKQAVRHIPYRNRRPVMEAWARFCCGETADNVVELRAAG